MLIKNRKCDFNPTDKAFIDVADVNSYATQFARQMDWQFRIYAQLISRVQFDNYKVYFFTLTFKDKFLPRFEYKGISCPCFDHNLINKFCRGVQNDLLRYWDATDYDYVLCEEFGKQRTFRSHLHGCFAVPDTVPPLGVLRLIQKHWSVLTGEYKKNGCPKRESIGWVLPSKLKVPNHSDFEVSPSCIDSCAVYLSKYCTKQIGWYSNPDVKKVYKKVIEDGNKEIINRFRKVQPRVKTSLHFGECIKDWIFGVKVPTSVKVTKDVNFNLFYGIMTPLYRKGYTRIPFYIRRKLMWQKVEEYTEHVEDYEENEYYTYDIFSNHSTRNLDCRGCTLTAFDVYKGLRPIIKNKKFRYKWDLEISDFWRSYMPYEFEHRLKGMVDRITDCQCWLPTSNFHNWLKTKLDKDNYDLYCKIIKDVKPYDLAVYSIAYKGKVSPLHLYAFLQNPSLFKDSVSITEVNCFYFDRYAKKSYPVLIEEYNHSYYNYVTTYVEKDVELDASLAEIQRPFFSGHESIEEMNLNSLDFYMSKANYCSRAYYHVEIPDNFNVTFNSFPCYRNFDLILCVLNDYMNECTEKKLKVISDKFEKKQELKNNFYGLEM